MNKIKILVTAAALTILASLSCASLPAFAEGESAKAETEPTFAVTDEESSASLRFGGNVLYAGDDLKSSIATDGLFLSFGNTLQLNSRSDYAIIAGNTLDIAVETERDVFAAGNIVTFAKESKIGRDIFVAGNKIVLNSNLNGDFSATANKVIIDNVTIKGNVNLDVATIEFRGAVKIEGKLIYNDTAEVTGLEKATYAEKEVYTVVDHSPTAAERWLAKFMSMCGLFVILVIIALAFKNFKAHIDRESTAARFGINWLRGIGFIAVAPIIILTLLLTFFAASAGVALIGVYILALYIAQVFAGAWLGHVFVEKICRSNLPIIAEGAIGIVAIGCLSMIPGLGLLVAVLTAPLGIGLMTSWIRPGKNAPTIDNSTETSPKTLENPFRKNRSTTKSASVKSTKTSSTKSTSKSSTKKPAQKAKK